MSHQYGKLIHENRYRYQLVSWSQKKERKRMPLQCQGLWGTSPDARRIRAYLSQSARTTEGGVIRRKRKKYEERRNFIEGSMRIVPERYNST